MLNMILAKNTDLSTLFNAVNYKIDLQERLLQRAGCIKRMFLLQSI